MQLFIKNISVLISEMELFEKSICITIKLKNNLSGLELWENKDSSVSNIPNKLTVVCKLWAE